MAKIKAFRALRPRADLAAQIVSLPYDVLDREEARREIKKHPLSFLRITKAEAELPDATGPYEGAVYEKARENLDLYRREGWLSLDDTPCLYIYRQKMGEHQQIGVAAAASAEEYRAGLIKKHEFTRPDKENDRVNHIKHLAAQTGPVFLVYRGSPLVASLVAEAMAGQKPAYDFTSDDGVEHALYVVAGNRLKEALIKSFAELDALYIADGHHRCAAALRAADLARSANPSHTGEEEYNYFLSVLFPDDQTHILAYHRVVKDLRGLSPAAFLDELRAVFQVEKLPGAREPRQKHEFSLYLAGDWYALTAQDFLYKEAGPVARLDVSLLQDHVLSPFLGITDPRTDGRIDFVGGVRGLAELTRLVDEGLYAAAFALYPTSMAQVVAIADAGLVMPPKSTWFEPKLRDAMAIHLLEDQYLKGGKTNHASV